MIQEIEFVNVVTFILSGDDPDGYTFVNAEAAAYVGRMLPQPGDIRKEQIDALFTALKAGAISGTNLLTKLDVLVLFKSHAQQPSLLNAISNNFNATLIGTPTFTEDNGWSWLGSPDLSAINTNYNPVAAAGNFTQNNACFGYWENLNLSSTASRYGWYDGADGVTVNPRSASGDLNQIVARLNQSPTFKTVSGPATDARGLTMVNRTDATNVQIYKNGVQVQSLGGQTSTALNDASFKLGGITAGGFVACSPWCHVAGASLTANEHLDLYNALNAHFSAL